MPAKKRTGSCSECGKALYNPAAKVCGGACRQRRARRIKRQNEIQGERLAEQNRLPEELAALKMDDELRAVAREELRPVVREAITEDVLQAAAKLVGLTGKMVAAIEEDLTQTKDPVLRQKAYTLLARHTLGNTSIAPQPKEEDKAPMQVVFQLPRPGDQGAPAIEVPAVETRQCTECTVEKPVDEFVGASDRCSDCHEKLQAQIRARFG